MKFGHIDFIINQLYNGSDKYVLGWSKDPGPSWAGKFPAIFCGEIVEKTLALNLFYVWQRTGDDFIVPLLIM